MHQTLDSVEGEEPNGLVLSTAVLRDQVIRIHKPLRACHFAEVTTALPELIRELDRAYYWIIAGRGLSKLPGRGDDAVRALRTMGLELRGMAYRAGMLTEEYRPA